MAELIDDISHIQAKIAPHVERYNNSRKADTRPDAISIYAAQTSVALTELYDIVESHQQTKSINPEMDDETFSKAEQAIDTTRHVNYKLHQRTLLIPQCSSVDMGLESAYQKGQSWLLSVSKGTDYADALLWQYTNQHTNRTDPRLSRADDGSKQLWPPTFRTMKQTRGYLDPPAKWLKQRKVEFEDCTHTLDELKEIHRERAVERLKRGGMNEWERYLIGRAVERSGGSVPAIDTGVDTREATVAEEEGLFAIGSDDSDEEERFDLGLHPSGSRGPIASYMVPVTRVSKSGQARRGPNCGHKGPCIFPGDESQPFLAR